MALADVLLVASPRFAEHETPQGHPERPGRAEVMFRVAERWRSAGGRITEPEAVTDEALARVHDGDYLRSIAATSGRRVRLDPDTYASPESEAIARLCGGRDPGGGRSCARPRRRRTRLCPAAGPPRRAVARHGLLPLQQRRGGGGARSGARCGPRGGSRLRRPPRQRDAMDLLRRSERAVCLDAPVPVLSRHRCRGRRRPG